MATGTAMDSQATSFCLPLAMVSYFLDLEQVINVSVIQVPYESKGGQGPIYRARTYRHCLITNNHSHFHPSQLQDSLAQQPLLHHDPSCLSYLVPFAPPDWNTYPGGH